MQLLKIETTTHGYVDMAHNIVIHFIVVKISIMFNCGAYIIIISIVWTNYKFPLL
jgi:hypothetical protein